MRDIPLTLVHPDLSVRPSYVCPPGYRIRSYQDGDEEWWYRIEVPAGAFSNEARARQQFQTEFAPVRDRLPGRMLFLEHADAEPIGTTTAWEGEFAGELRGRIHWVGIVPEWQGRGLAKPLLSAAMDRLAAEYARGYVTTETTSYRGINLYLGFGFVPWVETDLDREGWAVVEDVLGRTVL